MRIQTLIKNKTILLLLLNFIFFVLNMLITQKIQLPWIDEVMFTDTPATYLLTGKWSTMAWYSSHGAEPFSTYPPLYQLGLTIWLYIWGINLEAVRSLNLCLMMLLTWQCFRLFKRIKPSVNMILSIFLFFLMWMPLSMMKIYHMGRPDILNASFSMMVLISSYDYIVKKKSYWPIIIWSFGVFTSGIQSCAFVAISLIFTFCIFVNERRRIFHSLMCFASGAMLGFITVCTFMHAMGHLSQFIKSSFGYSATLRKLLLPFYNEYFGTSIDVEPHLSNSNSTFLEDILQLYTQNSDYLLLLFISILLIVIIFTCSPQVKKKLLKPSYLIVFAALTPLLMRVVGRFVFYYSWMCYIPLALSLILLISLLKKSISITIMISIITYYGYTGICNADIWGNNDYKKIEAFIQKIGLKSDDNISSIFKAFYLTKNREGSTYFTQIYPIDFIKEKIDLIITDKSDMNHDKEIKQFLERIRTKQHVTIKLVSEEEKLGLKAFRITYNL